MATVLSSKTSNKKVITKKSKTITGKKSVAKKPAKISQEKNNIKIINKTRARNKTEKNTTKDNSIKKLFKNKSTSSSKKITCTRPDISIYTNPDECRRYPLGHLLVEEMLRKEGFRGGISSSQKVLDKYSTDESIFSIRPQLVLQPKTKEDIKLAVKIINREIKNFPALSLTPRAAGTGLSGGSLTDSIVIDVCTHLTKMGEVKKTKDKITFDAEPGVMWRDMEKKLKQHKVYIPSYTSSKDICSLGGSIANNAAGPDSLRYGHCADWVEELEVILRDGNSYILKPLTFKEYQKLIKEKNEHARIAKEIFTLIEKNEKEILKNKPKTSKNSAGYALWNVFSDGVNNFKKGKGTFDLTRMISGSQGTIGVVTNIKMRALPIQENTSLLVIPVFDLPEAAIVIQKALAFNPINVEIFDDLTFDLSLKNPTFFKDRMSASDYLRFTYNLYTTYHLRFKGRTPEFTILITLDKETTDQTAAAEIAKNISTDKTHARVIKNRIEAMMYWQVRLASYSLSKFQDKNKRPAAFLEDMTVPPENLAKFFTEIKRLLKEFKVKTAVHGHGGNGHFHFYPLLDFTDSKTPKLVEDMAEKFYSTAIKFKGNICGEHNDGIIRTPHLNKLFTKKMLEIFVKAERIFDTDDIFNPGKKVNPRFDTKSSMRKVN